MNTVAEFSVPYHRYLGSEGTLTKPLPDCVSIEDDLIPIYECMVLTRQFDTRAVALQRTGRLGTYASSLGQEAVSVVTGHAMRTEDVLFPTYREHGAQIKRGVTLEELLLYWGGDERGSNFAGPREDFPVCIPIATQCTHAAGAATAFKLRGESRVAVAMCGDGATSKGDFYEALNLAGVWDLPIVFVVTNNQWAISVPRHRQSKAETLAQKAFAAGIAGVQIDGNDVVGMLSALREALEKARDQRIPTVIEALTYRLADHTTADDATRYRSTSATDESRRLEPLARLATFLRSGGFWDDDRDSDLSRRVNAKIESAVESYQQTPPSLPQSMFDDLYETLPKALANQRAEVSAAGEAGE